MKVASTHQVVAIGRRSPHDLILNTLEQSRMGALYRFCLNALLFIPLFSCFTGLERCFAQGALNYGLLADIESDPADGSSSPLSFTVATNGTYFLDRDGRLWFTDGTRPGTKEISLKGSAPTSLRVGTPRSMIPFKDTIAFAASFTDPTGAAGCRQSSSSTPSCDSQGLFIVNSDNSGVALVREKIYIADSPAGKINEQRILSIGQKLVFFAIESHSTESWYDSNSLWVSDGTRSGTFLLHTLDGGRLSVKQKISAGGRIYFGIHRSQTFEGLWTSDGTVAGTTRINSNFPDQFRFHNGELFFQETIYEDYRSNYYLSKLDPVRSPTGITARAPLSSLIYSGLSFPLLYPSGNYIYFLEQPGNYQARFLSLKRADAKTLNISNVQIVEKPNWLTNFNGTLYFVATTDQAGEELFRVTEGSSGTGPSVRMAADIRSGPSSSSPTSLTPFGNELFFSADGGDHGRELWKIGSGGNSAQLAIDILSGLNSSSPTELTASSNFIVMSAHNSTYGREPWVATRWNLGEFPAPPAVPTTSPGSGPGKGEGSPTPRPGAGESSKAPRPEAYPYNATGRAKDIVKLKYAVYYQGSTCEEITVYRRYSAKKLFSARTYYGNALSSGVIYRYHLNTRHLKRGSYSWCVNSFTESGRSGTAKCASLMLR